MRTVFGREPAVIAGLVEGLVLLLTTFGLGWTTDQITSVNAAVAAALAVYVWWGTTDVWSGPVLQLAKALLVLLAGFGLDMGPDRTAAVLGAITLAVGFFARTQLTAEVPAPPPAPAAAP